MQRCVSNVKLTLRKSFSSHFFVKIKGANAKNTCSFYENILIQLLAIVWNFETKLIQFKNHQKSRLKINMINNRRLMRKSVF